MKAQSKEALENNSMKTELNNIHSFIEDSTTIRLLLF